MPKNQALVILHGWQSSGKAWEQVQQRIQAAGIKVVVLDLPGFKKENQLNRAWNLNDYVKWFDDFVNKEIGEPFFLLGHSFGGRMSIKYAAENSKKLKGMILVSAAGVTKRPKLKILVFGLISKIGNLVFSFSFLKKMEPLARKVLYKLIGARDYRLLRTERMKETFRNIINEDLSNLLYKIETPSLMIWGNKDKMTPLKDAYFLKKKISNSKLDVLKGVNHAPHIEVPELVAEKVIKFIK